MQKSIQKTDRYHTLTPWSFANTRAELARFGGHLLLAALDLYVVQVWLYVVARAVFGVDFWFVALLSNFMHWLTLPALVVLPLLVWQRAWLRAALWAVPIVFFVVNFGGLFVVRPAEVPPGAVTLRVMSYNIGAGYAHPQTLQPVLLASNADLIALVEVSAWQATELGQDPALLQAYPYRFLYGDGSAGKGLFSRYPILEHTLFELEIKRPHLLAKVDVQGQVLTLLISHPPRPGFRANGKIFGDHPAFEAEIGGMLAHIDPHTPTLLVGDLNMVDQNPNHRRLRAAGFSDAFRAAGWGFGATYPAKLPLVRIDYIWSSPHFIPLASAVGGDGGSDHLPIISDLAFIKTP